MIELIFELFLEILAQIVFELFTSFGWESLKKPKTPERKRRPLFADAAQFLMGVAAGVLSLFLFPARLTQRILFPGISLILSPLGTGLAMHWLGEAWEQRGRRRPALFHFRAGALFALGMALVRFVYLQA